MLAADLLLPQVQRLALVFARVVGLFAVAPVFSNRFVPVTLRVALALACSLAVLPVLPPLATVGWARLMALVAAETLVGATAGFAATLVFAAVQFAGQLLDIDMGFGVAGLLDPGSGAPAAIVGSLHWILALLLFLSLDGHHGLLLVIAASYQAVPLGGFTLGEAPVAALLAMGGELFRSGLVLAAPVLATLFLTTVALAVVNRAVPQVNVFMIGLPVKAAVGLVTLLTLLPLYLAAMTRLLAGLLDRLYGLLPLLHGA